MSYPQNSPTTTVQFDQKQIIPAGNQAVQLAQQDKVLNGAINRLTSLVTGVTLNYTGLATTSRLLPGSYTLAWTASGTFLSIGGGANVAAATDGNYVLTAPNGRQVNALVVAASTPVGNQSDNISVDRGIGKTSKQILWNTIPEPVTQFLQGVEFIKGNFATRVSQPVNVTGVSLVFTGLTDQEILEVGTHALAFTAAGTLLGIGGGATQNVGAGGTFTLVAPDGAKVKAIVVGASIPVGDQSDTITVSSYPLASKVLEDPAFRNQLTDIYHSA